MQSNQDAYFYEESTAVQREQMDAIYDVKLRIIQELLQLKPDVNKQNLKDTALHLCCGGWAAKYRVLLLKMLLKCPGT